MNILAIVALLIALIALGVGMYALLRPQKTMRLRAKFGPEYDHLVDREGDHRKAEAELAHREARVKKLHIRELTPEERDRFAHAWRQQQVRFVDDPHTSVSEADRLVTEVMQTRGYETTDFGTQLADVSVDHARVVGNYREAHTIAERSRKGQATTEDLRRAIICYRGLFEDLLGGRVLDHHPEEARR